MRSKEFALDANQFHYVLVDFQALESPKMHSWRERGAWISLGQWFSAVLRLTLFNTVPPVVGPSSCKVILVATP